MMKSVVLILLVAVVAGISANPTPPNTNCCFADQFELEADDMVGVVDSGKGVAIGQSLKMAFDYTNKRLGALVTTSAGTFVYDYRMIIDFNKGVELFIDDKSKTCQKMPFNSTEMVHCIPAKAKLLDTFYMGNNEITANSFAYQYTEGPSTGELTMAVTKTDCIPLSSSFVGETAGTALMVGAGFKNYVAGIKDPATYFTVPSYCPQTVSSKPGAYYKHLLFQ
ncbi:development-specific protein LVN1.2-like [Asterias amurensis]|uniref:development-specific protein LVN1.2-like n=1 Tax=Asterias amurensis TaxID=7602 RepID=UPI003AB480CC